MGPVTDFLVTLADLVESVSDLMQHKVQAQAAVAKNTVRRVMVFAAVMVAAVILLLFGFGFLIWGIYALLALVVSAGTAAIIVGIGVAIIGIILAFFAGSVMK